MTDHVEVRSADLGDAVWKVAAEPLQMRALRRVVAFEVKLSRPPTSETGFD
jgi:hypothetical protein